MSTKRQPDSKLTGAKTAFLEMPETVPMLLWALLASGQIQMRKVDGWETLDQLIADETLDRAA